MIRLRPECPDDAETAVELTEALADAEKASEAVARTAQELREQSLFARPELRERGGGTQLLSALAAIAVERGCARMERAVLNWNELASAFYRAFGALPLDDWTTFRLTGAPLEALADRG